MRHDILVSDLCDEIDDLTFRLEKAQAATKYWRDKFNEEINASISHSEKMIGSVIVALLEKAA